MVSSVVQIKVVEYQEVLCVEHAAVECRQGKLVEVPS